MRVLLFLVFATISFAQTSQVIQSGSSAPGATFDRYLVDGDSRYVVTYFDRGTFILSKMLTSPLYSTYKGVIRDFRFRPTTSFTRVTSLAGIDAPPNAPFDRYQVDGASAYVVTVTDRGYVRPDSKMTIQGSMGAVGYRTVIWRGAFTGPPLDPPKTDGINNPIQLH